MKLRDVFIFCILLTLSCKNVGYVTTRDPISFKLQKEVSKLNFYIDYKSSLGYTSKVEFELKLTLLVAGGLSVDGKIQDSTDLDFRTKLGMPAENGHGKFYLLTAEIFSKSTQKILCSIVGEVFLPKDKSEDPVLDFKAFDKNMKMIDGLFLKL
ncbi:MAG: hypothetical protein NE334_09295 [Lentisphaeraceae bacterium]|nr:hypothetical protein [Lentisphaeraceae bacterium]